MSKPVLLTDLPPGYREQAQRQVSRALGIGNGPTVQPAPPLVLHTPGGRQAEVAWVAEVPASEWTAEMVARLKPAERAEYERIEREEGFPFRRRKAAKPAPAPDGWRARLKQKPPAPADTRLEKYIQRDIAAWLESAGYEFQWARMDRATGSMVGWPDFTLATCPPAGAEWGVPVAIEIKRAGGALSGAQRERIASMRARGWVAEVCCSLRQVQDLLAALEAHAGRATP